jgi:glutaconate CoA-transferase, subunit A
LPGTEVRQSTSKVIPLEQAVSKFVSDGDTLAFASSGGRMSIAFSYEVIKQRRKRLRFASAGTGAPCLDLLVGAKAVDQAEASFTMISCYNIRRQMEKGPSSRDRGYRFVLEDYSNLAMTLRFAAAAMRIPFIPIRSLRGSDIERYRTFMGKQKMALMKSPFKDRSSVVVLPPCKPDLAVMHAQFADQEGNVLAYGPAGSDNWAMRAALKRVVTVEKVVSSSFVRENRTHTFLPSFMVDAVCEVPYGAHPYGLVDWYDLDAAFQKQYAERSKTQDAFDDWAKEWIFGIKTRQDYLDKVGPERLSNITNGRLASLAKR